MANTKVSGDLIQDGAISQNHLNESHGITTSDIGEGTALYYTDARVANYLTTNNYATQSYVGTITTNSTNWDTAYSWGDHSLVGYLTTETDPVFVASPAYGITSTNITNWNTAYGWGDHATQSYATQTYVNTAVANLVDTAPTTLDTLNELAAALGDDPNFATTVSGQIGLKLDTSTWTASAASGITSTQVSNWDTAYGWGNHASAGYLTTINTPSTGSWWNGGFVHVAGDGVMEIGKYIDFHDTSASTADYTYRMTATGSTMYFSGSIAATGYNNTNWDTAYGWGNHASAGYAAASSLSSYLPLTGGTIGTTTFSSVYSGGSGDFTNVSTPSYKVSSASGYWRIPHLSGSSITSGVYNYQTGKSVYWGEPNDTGDYRFRGRTLYAETGLRAPSFYDYSDTNYYVDPNGTSQLNYLNITGSPNGASLQLGSNDFSRTLNDAARPGLVINGLYYPHIDINATNNANNANHGPVFSMTGILTAGGWRRWGMGIANTNPDALSWGYYDNQSNPHYSVGGTLGYTTTGANMWLNTGGNLQTTGSMRSPIFYDSNDTNYYIDPNGTSRTNVLTSFSLRNNYDVSVNHTYGMYFSNAGGESYSIFRESGAWSHPYPDLRIAFHTGIKLGAYYGYNGIRFYNNHDMVTQTASIGDGDNNLRGYYDIIAYASDKRLKEKIEPITNAVDKVKKLNGFTYNWNSVGEEYGWEPPKERESGVFAQEVQEVLPEAVRTAPFDQAHDEDGNMHSKSGENFLTVKYEKLVPLLIEAIKEQQQQIEELKQLINK